MSLFDNIVRENGRTIAKSIGPKGDLGGEWKEYGEHVYLVLPNTVVTLGPLEDCLLKLYLGEVPFWVTPAINVKEEYEKRKTGTPINRDTKKESAEKAGGGGCSLEQCAEGPALADKSCAVPAKTITRRRKWWYKGVQEAQ